MRSVTTIFLLAFCLVSALSLIWIRQENRVLTPHLHDRYSVRDELNIEWRELLAQHSVASRRENLKTWTEREGNMHAPDKEIVLLLKKQNPDWLSVEGQQ